VQILAADRVELTVMLDKADYRRISADAPRRRGRLANLLLLPIPLGAFVSLAAEQVIGALVLVFTMLCLVGFGFVNRSRQIGGLPDWAFGPTTYRITAEGCEIDQVMARRSIRWEATEACRKTTIAYWIQASSSTSIAVPRRQLTPADEAALEAVLTRFCPGAALPAATPPATDVPAAPAGPDPDAPRIVRRPSFH
jgi:hypothetical protein